jgi:hypothetical protein
MMLSRAVASRMDAWRRPWFLCQAASSLSVGALPNSSFVATLIAEAVEQSR